MVGGMPAPPSAAEGRRDAGQETERNAFARQRQRFLAAAAEYVRVAALQAKHAASGLGERYQLRCDLILLDRRLPTALSHENQLGLFGDRDHCGVYQRVIDKRIGLHERRRHVEREAARVAGTRPGQPDMARLETRRPVLQKSQRLLNAHATTFCG